MILTDTWYGLIDDPGLFCDDEVELLEFLDTLQSMPQCTWIVQSLLHQTRQ